MIPVVFALAALEPQLDLTAVPLEERAKAAVVHVYGPEQQAPTPVKVLGEVRATSCRNHSGDPPPTRDEVAAQLQLKAARLGATAVVSTVFTADFPLAPFQKCPGGWVQGTGIAVTTQP